MDTILETTNSTLNFSWVEAIKRIDSLIWLETRDTLLPADISGNVEEGQWNIYNILYLIMALASIFPYVRQWQMMEPNCSERPYRDIMHLAVLGVHLTLGYVTLSLYSFQVARVFMLTSFLVNNVHVCVCLWQEKFLDSETDPFRHICIKTVVPSLLLCLVSIVSPSWSGVSLLQYCSTLSYFLTCFCYIMYLIEQMESIKCIKSFKEFLYMDFHRINFLLYVIVWFSIFLNYWLFDGKFHILDTIGFFLLGIFRHVYLHFYLCYRPPLAYRGKDGQIRGEKPRRRIKHGS